jgi:glyoxylase-like metal-dependent hydrolase (beta-lactamase superfamily II)
MIGEYKVSSLIEYFGPTHDPNFVFPDFDRKKLEANLDWLVPNHYHPGLDRFIVAIQIWVVQAGSDIIVIDTGVGNGKPRPAARMNKLNSLIPLWMEAAGARADKVTHVVMTHLHGDHVGWNTVMKDGRWVPTFPNARYHMPKNDFAYFKGAFEKGPPDGGSFYDSILPVVQAGLVDFIEDQKEVAGCLAVEQAPGHTPGQLNYRLRSRGEEGVFSADIFHNVIQIACPTWNTAFCVLPDEARKTRAAFLERNAKSGALVMPCHFGFPHCGFVRKQGEGYGFEPAAW